MWYVCQLACLPGELRLGSGGEQLWLGKNNTASVCSAPYYTHGVPWDTGNISLTCKVMCIHPFGFGSLPSGMNSMISE